MIPTDAPGQRVGIVVVSWNTRELLGRCLDSMRGAVEAGRAEVVVVDNASEDGSSQLVREKYGWVALHASERNLGFGAAANIGAARTSTGFVAPSNADVELLPGALEALLAAASADPAAGSFAPRLLRRDGRIQHSVHSFPSLRLALAFNLGARALSPALADRLCLDGSWNPAVERPVDWAHGAFLLIRREAWEAVGGFDQGQWMYAEDLDLAWRLRRAGWATRYVPAAQVRHEVSAATAQAFGAERAARHMAAAQDWMVRRRGRPAATAYAALNVLGSAVRLVALSALAALGMPRARSRRALELRYLRLHARAIPAGAGRWLRGGR